MFCASGFWGKSAMTGSEHGRLSREWHHITPRTVCPVRAYAGQDRVRTAAGLGNLGDRTTDLDAQTGSGRGEGGPQSGSGVSGAPRSEVQTVIGKLGRRLLV